LQAIEDPFLVSISQTLGERLTANLEKTYRKTINFVLTTLIMGFKDDFPTAEDAGGNNVVNTY
jgi:hypothetical protein